MNISSWGETPENLSIEFQDVHVWRMRLDVATDLADEWINMLSADEVQRANRLRSGEDRSRFIAAHYKTRQILGNYLDLIPNLINFAYNQHGKPGIIDPIGSLDIKFNLSHSENIGLLAVASGLNVGVDVERIKHSKDLAGIAKRFFSQGEVNLLQEQPVDLYAEGFFRIWTRKEAYIKASGEGMGIPLDQFEVNFLPGEDPKIKWIKGESNAGEQWTLRHLDPADGFIGALVVDGNPEQVMLYSWGENWS